MCSLLKQAEDEALGRAESGFVGLDNQGATCYLNALLQVQYMSFTLAFRGVPSTALHCRCDKVMFCVIRPSTVHVLWLQAGMRAPGEHRMIL